MQMAGKLESSHLCTSIPENLKCLSLCVFHIEILMYLCAPPVGNCVSKHTPTSRGYDQKHPHRGIIAYVCVRA
jgi:hypothetical protein